MSDTPPAVTDFEIRRLVPADAALYRELRLEGLKHHPEAFGASFDEEAAQPLAWFAERLAGNVVLAGRAAEAAPGGIVGLHVPGTAKTRHRGVLWGMYVRPGARRNGLAARLLERLLDEARSQVETVTLSVVTTNEPALRLYRRHGFTEFGLDKGALRNGGRDYDEYLMSRSVGDNWR